MPSSCLLFRFWLRLLWNQPNCAGARHTESSNPAQTFDAAIDRYCIGNSAALAATPLTVIATRQQSRRYIFGNGDVELV